jgi:hypothetical protein
MKCSASKSLQLLVAICCLFMCFSATAQNQNVSIAGKIVNQNGEPVPGASITISGSTGGTTARQDGTFSLTVPNNKNIIVSAVGYSDVQYRVTGANSAVTITMVSSNAQLDQVVVVGYGTQRKEAVTGSVATISGNALREVP